MAERQMTEQELDAKILSVSRSAYADDSKKFEDELLGKIEEKLGQNRREIVADIRSRSQAEWAGMGNRQRLDAFKRAVLGGARPRQALGAQEGPGPKFGKGMLFARMIPHFVNARGDWRRAWEFAQDDPGMRVFFEPDADGKRALSPDTIAGGGVFIPDVLAADFIAFLYAETVVRATGSPTVVDISEGNLKIPRGTASATASWIGSTDAIPSSNPTFGDLNLDAKKLGVFVPVPNDLIRRAQVAMLSVIRDDMMAVAAEAEDIGIIRGPGNQGEILGIRNTPGINTFAQTGAGHQEKTDDLVDAENNVENAKIRVRSGAWYMSTRTKGGLLKTLTADGAQAFRTEMVVNGTLNGWPFGATTAIPTNLGGGSDSELYFVESRMLMIGETLRMELSEHEGSYNDGAAQRNTVQRDERVLRLIHEVDSALRRPEAATVVTGITY